MALPYFILQMNLLDLTNINHKAPYQVFQLKDYPHLFYFHTEHGAEGKMNGQMNFMAIISRRDNPQLEIAVSEFEETISYLFD